MSDTDTKPDPHGGHIPAGPPFQWRGRPARLIVEIEVTDGSHLRVEISDLGVITADPDGHNGELRIPLGRVDPLVNRAVNEAQYRSLIR